MLKAGILLLQLRQPTDGITSRWNSHSVETSSTSCVDQEDKGDSGVVSHKPMYARIPHRTRWHGIA